MKLRILLFCILHTGSAQIYAQDSKCESVEGAVINSLNELPAEVQDLLGRSERGFNGISDIGGKFNSSDVISDSTIPMRRLVSGTVGPNCVRLIVEHGGSGYGKTQLEFERFELRWVQVKSVPVTSGKTWSPRLAK